MDEVHFTLTRDDFWHLQLYGFWRQQRRTILPRLIIIIIISVCAVIVLGQLFSGNYSFSAVFTLFLVLFAILLASGFLFLRLWLATSRSSEVLGKRGVNVLTISEQGVQARNELSNGTSAWRAFKAIEEDKRNIYFVMEQPGRLFMAHLIPKRVFEGPPQAERFIARARGYWQEQAGQVATSHA